MNSKLRTALLAVAFSSIATVAIIGATLRGETRESVAYEDVCASAAWPMIPADCLKGSNGREVRLVGEDVVAYDAEDDAEAQEEQADAAVRFATDFN